MRVALSISESPDLARLGLSELHLEDAMLEMARYLLARGHRLAYGGDLRPSGFTRSLRELAEMYGAASSQKLITNFLAWYVWQEAPAADLAWLAQFCTLRKCEKPEGLASPPEPSQQCVKALCLLDMRQGMTTSTEARVLLGGRLTDFSSRMPGLIEEALLMVEAGKPLYLLGAFGGCTAAVIQALQGREPESFTVESHEAWKPGFQRLLAEIDGRLGSEVGSLGMKHALQRFHALGVDGLSKLNGLTPQENEVLFNTQHLPVAISLVLQGLERVQART